jgi:hypothetical protein
LSDRIHALIARKRRHVAQAFIAGVLLGMSIHALAQVTR